MEIGADDEFKNMCTKTDKVTSNSTNSFLQNRTIYSDEIPIRTDSLRFVLIRTSRTLDEFRYVGLYEIRCYKK